MSNIATQAGEGGGGKSLIYENVISKELGENFKHLKGNLRDYLRANTLVRWSRQTLKIGMQQENMQEVKARVEHDGGFQQDTLHLKENKT